MYTGQDRIDNRLKTGFSELRTACTRCLLTLSPLIYMSAITYGDHTKDVEDLEVTKFTVPSAVELNQILLKTLATPINPSDLLLIRGVYGAFPPKVKLSETDPVVHVAGNEGVFEVTKVGKNIKGYSEGDWVILTSGRLGTWRTHVLVDYPEGGPEPLFKVKSAGEGGLKKIEGATLSVNPPTAYQLVHNYVKDWNSDGKDWIVQNAGGSHVAQFLTQFARLLNVNVLSVIRGGKPNHDEIVSELKLLGATAVITEEQAQSEQFRNNELKSIFNGGNVRLAINCLGGALATALFLMLSPDGAMVTYGALTNDPITYPLRWQQYNNLTTHGYFLTGNTKRNPQLKIDTLNAVIKLYKLGKLQVPPATLLEFKDGNLLDLYLQVIKSGKKGIVKYESN